MLVRVMIYREENRDLFKVGKDYYFVQCISADFAMGAGIALQFNKYFSIKNKLVSKYKSFTDRWDSLEEHGTCLLEGRVYNLITKRSFWNKPTEETMRNALKSMRVMINNNQDCKKLAMPKIGSGLDKMSWSIVSKLLQETFEDSDIEILVCYI